MKRAKSRRCWTAEEDMAITKLVSELGCHSWSLLASQLRDRFNIAHRNGKQCRERWHNHLDAGIDKTPWSVAEERVLFEQQAIHGNSWAEIAKHLPGRTDNSVKNHYYCTVRKRHRKPSQQHSSNLMDEVRLLLYLQKGGEDIFYVPRAN